MVVSITVGSLLGSVSGYFGGIVDTIIMRFTDAMLSIPGIFLIIALAVFLGQTILTITLAIGELLLGHMGGPFWARKDDGAWSIPKGEHGPDEQPQRRRGPRVHRGAGRTPPPGPLVELGTVRQRGGKRVTVFARHADFDAEQITPGTFELEWPPRSGRLQASRRSTGPPGSTRTPPAASWSATRSSSLTGCSRT